MNTDGQKIIKVPAEVVESIKAIVGKDNIDASSESCIFVKPSTADEVSKIVVAVTKANVPIATSNSPEITLCGNKYNGGLFMDLGRMDSVGEVDKVAMSIKVGAGAKWENVIEAVCKAGLLVGSHPRDLSAYVGAWAVCDSPELGSYKYGTSKNNILNFELVNPKAEIMTTGYDNIGAYMSGYNLNDMFADSKGTRGIVTSVTIKLVPKGVMKACAYTFDNIDAMQDAINKLVHHASIKPRDIFSCVRSFTISISMQESQDFLDNQIPMLDELMASVGGKKADDGRADELYVKRSKCVIKRPRAVVPVSAMKQMAEKCGDKIFGFLGDRSSFVVVSPSDDADALETKAKELGGKLLKVEEFKWDPMSLKSEEPSKDITRLVTPQTVSSLEDIVGKKNLTVNEVDLLLYSHDLAPLPKMAGMAFKNMPDVVVRPSNVEEISQIIRLAHKNGIAVTPRGNSTWGLGGCMPTNGGIIVDMSSRMKKVHKIDTENLTVKCDAGITWKSLLEACMKEGYIVGSYPSSFPAGTIGAWLATNGMGVGSYKYGSARENVLNMEVVVSDGTIVETGMDKINDYMSGYNLNQFFAGSEGTLCIFGTVTFRIYPMGKIKPLAYEYENLKDANPTIQAIVNHSSIKPLHIAWSDYKHFEGQRRAGLHAPNVKNLLLITFQGDEKELEFEVSLMDAMAAADGAKKVDDSIAEHEWSERCYEFRARCVGVGEIPAEVIVPAASWGDFTEECYKGFDVMKMEAGGVIGVVVDRNTVLFMPYYFKDDESLLGMTAFAFNFYLGDRAGEYGGRTTGFGVFFAWNLDVIHDPACAKYMREMKTVMDPYDVVDPGHLVCGMTRFGINMSKQIMGLGSNVIQLAKKMLPPNTTFSDNLSRFRYNTLEERKALDRVHELGNGTQ